LRTHQIIPQKYIETAVYVLAYQKKMTKGTKQEDFWQNIKIIPKAYY